jgi:hypothetical protein
VWLEQKEKFALGAGIGLFGDNSAVAISGVARIQGHLSVNGALGWTEDGKAGGRVGVRYGW